MVFSDYSYAFVNRLSAQGYGAAAAQAGPYVDAGHAYKVTCHPITNTCWLSSKKLSV